MSKKKSATKVDYPVEVAEEASALPYGRVSLSEVLTRPSRIQIAYTVSRTTEAKGLINAVIYCLPFIPFIRK